MKMTEAARSRSWALLLALVTIITTVLIVVVNPLEAALVYLALLLGTIVLGLLTGLWGGLIAAAAGVVTITLLNQYAGIYARENAVANIATELAAFLLVGPLAGGLGRSIDRVQREADRWLARAEEITRARRFQRPLSIALLQLQANPDAPINQRAQRIAALQAVLRVARAATQPPALITHAGGDQVLMILPEQDTACGCTSMAFAARAPLRGCWPACCAKPGIVPWRRRPVRRR